jgi:hypothetical protein
MNTFDHIKLGIRLTVALVIVLILVSAGCGKSGNPSGTAAPVPKPKEAASQLQQVFLASDPEVKDAANAASKALQTSDYEKAVVTLEAIKARGNLTFDQGIAVHNSMVALETKLIVASESGDANAKRAYDLLKKFRRN